MSLECLNGLVGLSDRDCPCWTTDRPSTYNDSETGYYLTDPEYGFPLMEAVFAGSDCSDGSVWDMLLKARNKAIRDFQTDLQAHLYTTKASKYHVFAGLIGKDQSTIARTLTGTYQGILITPNNVKGGVLKISKIGLDIDTTTTVTVKVYSSADTSAALFSLPCNAVANKLTYTNLPIPLELPLYDQNVSELRYYMVYESPSFKPNNNKLYCCGHKPNWSQYIKVNGYNSNSLIGETGDGYSNGLVLQAHLSCDQISWVCDMDEVEGYNVKSVIGRAIQMKAAVKIISQILRSGNLNLYTMSNREAMYADKKRLQKAYENQILWLSENIPYGVTDCFQCDKNIRRKSILI